MIIGNPYEFAILHSKVDVWNIDDTFCNGILFFFLNGVGFPPQLSTTTLRFEISRLQEKFRVAPIINYEIFNMDKEDAFIAIYNITFSENTIDSSNYFDITPVSFSDQHCFVFVVSDGVKVRVLASTLTYIPEEACHCLKGIKIEEAFISAKDFEQVGNHLRRQG